MKHTTFIAVLRPASGHYDLDLDIDGTPLWHAIRERLFDAKAHERSEFCGSIMRAIWTCIYDDPFVIKHRASIEVHDNRGYVRPLDHILLDLVRMSQTKPEKSHRLIRQILGSDNLSDRFIGASNTAMIIFEDVPTTVVENTVADFPLLTAAGALPGVDMRLVAAIVSKAGGKVTLRHGDIRELDGRSFSISEARADGDLIVEVTKTDEVAA